MEKSEKYQSSGALVVCASPLQAELVLRLFHEADKPRTVIYFIRKYGEQEKFYHSQLKILCSDVIVKKHEPVSVLFSTFQLWASLFTRGTYAKLYVASFNAFFPLTIINRLPSARIYLYDDGAFSLLSTEDRQPYLQRSPKSVKLKAFCKVFKLELNPALILKTAQGVFSIYGEKQTLLPRQLLISYPNQNSEYWSEEYPFVCPLLIDITVFIGDVTAELTAADRELHASIIASPVVDYYIRHPRDQTSLKSSKNISLHTVAERFIQQLVKSGHRVRVLSLSSSVLYNLEPSEGIKKFMIYSQVHQLPSLSELAADFGIKIIDANELHLVGYDQANKFCPSQASTP